MASSTTELTPAAAPLSWPRVLGLLALFLVPMLTLSAYAWVKLPDGAQIPTHWNIHGQVDGYASKGFGLFLLPAVLAVLVPFIAGIVRLDPRKKNVADSQGFLLVTLAGTMLVLAGVHAAMVAIVLGYKVPMDLVVLTLVGGLFAVMGYAMGKVKSNFFMGVRTPWTLSSELSWTKTHLLMGRLFLASGVFTVLSAWLLSPVVATIILVVGSSISSVAAIIYSYVVWKNDPAAHAN